MTSPAYVIITLARNEGERIQKTIDSVVKQNGPPLEVGAGGRRFHR